MLLVINLSTTLMLSSIELPDCSNVIQVNKILAKQLLASNLFE